MSAFNVVTLMDKCAVKIECIEPWGEHHLIVGANDGSLLLMSVDTSVTPATCTCVDTNKTISRKPITQMVAADETPNLGVLVLLPQDGPISIHDLTMRNGLFPQRGQALAKTKGCTMFTLESRGSGVATLCCSLKRHIVIYNWDGNGFVELRDVQLVDGAKCFTWAAGPTLCIGSRREYSLVNAQNSSVTPLFPTGRTGASPCCMRLPDGLLVSRDNVGVFLHLDGSAAREHGVSWTEPPLSLVHHHPFILAMLPKFLEVKMATQTGSGFTQMLPVKSAKSLVAKDKSGVFACTTTSIYRIEKIPLAKQVEMFVSSKDFDTALAICDAMANSPEAQLRESRLRYTKTCQAYYLFSQGQYRRALDLFSDLRIDLLEVLGLYSILLPRDIRSAPQRHTSVPNVEVVELSGAARENANRALCAYLVQQRSSICTPEAIRRVREQQVDESDYGGCVDPACILDTTLLKLAAILSEDRKLTELCSCANACHVKECATALLQVNRTTEIVQLYRTKGLHARALELLAQTAAADPQPMARYLRSIGASYKDLVFTFASRLFALGSTNANEAALSVFTEGDRTRSEELPHNDVLAFLKLKAPGTVSSYLEFIINKQGETGADFHNELAFQYLDKIKQLRSLSAGSSQQQVPAGSEVGALGKTRGALLKFLESSVYYRPQALLTGERIPADDLYEERAIVLSKIGQHDKALEIYAIKLNNPKMAEEYCARIWRDDRDDSKDVYLNLLQVYLKAGGGMAAGQQVLESAMALLSKHYQRIDIGQALGLLPPATPLSLLMPFFEKVLEETARKKREGQVIRSLMRGESLRVHEEYIMARSPSVKIDELRLCAACNKPIRSSAFARYPNSDVVVHLMCLPKLTPQQQQPNNP